MTKAAVAPTRTAVATVRFDPSEYARLQLAAEERGVSVSELIRRVCLKRELPPSLPPRLDSEAVGQLRKLGVLLNQSVRLMAAWKRAAAEDKKNGWRRWQETTVDLRTMVADLAARLAGAK
jgi:hypothetical protein